MKEIFIIIGLALCWLLIGCASTNFRESIIKYNDGEIELTHVKDGACDFIFIDKDTDINTGLYINCK